MYHALYRTYRPKNFDSVVGQDSIIKTLKNAVKNGSFSHAYMFFGPRGTGKTTVSKIFARNINCLEPVDGNMCGKCKNCLCSSEKECVDIIEIDAASNNGVDEIRELRNKVSLVPAELKYKVYIIDEVHMLTLGAFNALLKTLEEPPEHVVFILATTDPQKVPETIISRCQCFSFKRISTNVIMDRLKYICEKENISIDDSVLEEIAITSEGGLRDALGLLDKLRAYTQEKITLDDFAEMNGVVTRKELNQLYMAIFNSEMDVVLKKIAMYEESGKNVILVITQLMNYIRNVVVDYYINSTSIPFNINDLELLINEINKNLFDIKRSGNPKVFIEILLIKFISLLQKNSGVFLNSKSVSESVDKIDEAVSKANEELGNLTNNIVNIEEVRENKLENFSNSSVPQKDNSSNFEKRTNKIKNIDEILQIRVKNTLARADKKVLENEIQKVEVFKDYTFDENIGYIACTLLDGKIRAASNESIIISYEYDSTVNKNIENLSLITEVYNNYTDSDKKIAIISDSEWEHAKGEYIRLKKENQLYDYVKEPEPILLEDEEKNDILVSSAVQLFGDIVEID